MPEPKQILVYFEGNDDGAVLTELRAAKLLPENLELAKRVVGQHPGKDGLVRQILPFVSPINGIGGHAVALIDLDELTFEQRFDWFHKQITQELHANYPAVTIEAGPALNERVRPFHLVAEGKIGRIALIAAGLPGDKDLVEKYKIDRFAMDDWIFRLIRSEKVFSAVSEMKSIPYVTAMAKFIEVADLFRKNNLEVRKSKTYVQILRALAAVTPGTATILSRFVQKGATTLATEEFRAALHPLLDDLDAAFKTLSAM